MIRTMVFLAAIALSTTSAFGGAMWIDGTDGSAGPHSVYAGHVSGRAVFVCRADGIPGKLIKEHGVCFIPYYEKEIEHDHYDVLQDPKSRMRWVHRSKAEGKKLVPGGWEDDMALWICRVDGNVGKLVSYSETSSILSNSYCFYGWYGKEIQEANYEVLTY